MPRRKKASVKRLDESHGEYFRRHAACPWVVAWREDGKYKRRFVADEDYARKLSRKIEDRINAHYRDLVPQNIPLRHAIERFIDNPELSPETLRSYKIILEKFGEATGWPDSDRWTIGLLDLYRRKRITEKASPATINKGLRTLSSFFNWACTEKNYIDRNPFDFYRHGKKRLKEHETVRSVWTKDQFRAVIDNCPDNQWRMAAWFAINGAGRRGVIEKLALTNIDFERNEIRIYEPKTKKTRIVPFHPKVLSELLKYIETMQDHQKQLFTHTFTPGVWKKICIDRAKVPHITFHHLRSVMAYWMEKAGVSTKHISIMFDHSSTKTTEDFYLKYDERDIRQQALSKLVFDW